MVVRNTLRKPKNLREKRWFGRNVLSIPAASPQRCSQVPGRPKCTRMAFGFAKRSVRPRELFHASAPEFKKRGVSAVIKRYTPFQKRELLRRERSKQVSKFSPQMDKNYDFYGPERLLRGKVCGVSATRGADARTTHVVTLKVGSKEHTIGAHLIKPDRKRCRS